jgi:hypothetical protein
MIRFTDYLQEGKRGLWDNIHAKQERIKNGSGERMRKPGSKGAPTAAALKASQTNEELTPEQMFDLIEEMAEQISEELQLDLEQVWEELDEFSDNELLEACNCWKGYKRKAGTKPCAEDSCVKEDTSLDEAAVDAKGYKSSTGGLTQKGRDAYNRKEGSNLQAPVTTPPSKLKKGSKAANRRKSFCARMSGVEGPMRKPNGEPTRKALALRKWNC